MSKKRLSSVRPSPSAARHPAVDGRPRNRLLAALPAADFRRIRPHLTTIPLTAKQVLLKRGDPLRHVYFPNGGVCSVTALMASGVAVEVVTVGDEGLVGISGFFGADTMPGETMVQVPDTSAERMDLPDFRRELDRRGAFYDVVSRYAQGTMALMVQSTACMALHNVEARCCRWLLMTHDRVKTDQFILSQEFLAMMIGAARPTVTLVARTLQDAGLIRYTHARMTLLDRPGLERGACECYATIRAEFTRLRL